MDSFRPQSTSDQLACHLRRQIEIGALKGVMPGVQQLVRILGINSVSVGKAIHQLEREGLLIHQGHRKSRLIAENVVKKAAKLRVGILYYDASNASRSDSLSIKQELINAGHVVVSPPKSMLELGMDVKRVAAQVTSMDVDAWVIFAGSRQILEWFEGQEVPAFALHGRLNQVDLAGIGVHKSPVIEDIVSRLVHLGHKRIVMIAREERRKPHPGLLEQIFLDALERHGIKTGPFNIPDWEDGPDGLESVMRSLFQVTPPTALIVGDSSLVHAVQVHLSSLGYRAPKDLSLLCNDFEDSFRWVRPDIAHIQWDYRPTVRRVSQWAKNVSNGKADRKKSHIKALLHEGSTLGSAPKAF